MKGVLDAERGILAFPPPNVSTAIGQSQSFWLTLFFQHQRLAWQTGSGPTRNTGHACEAEVGCRSLLTPCGF